MEEIKLSNPEFKRHHEGFRKELVKENKDDSYIYQYTTHVMEFLLFAEENGINTVTEMKQPFIDDYVRYLEETRLTMRDKLPLEEKTISKHKGAVRKFWHYLHAERVKVAPIRLKQRKAKQVKEPVVLTTQEIKQMYSVCDDTAVGQRDRAMLALYYGCGMRRKEGLRLLLSDIDFAKGRLHVRKSKNGRDRYVMMSPTVQRLIENYVYNYRDFYLADSARYDEFFIGERGRPVASETLAKRMEILNKRMKERYGSLKEPGLHALRHSLGTHLYMAGMSVEMVALMLGHRTLEATQLYIHSANQLKHKQRESV